MKSSHYTALETVFYVSKTASNKRTNIKQIRILKTAKLF